MPIVLCLIIYLRYVGGTTATSVPLCTCAPPPRPDPKHQDDVLHGNGFYQLVHPPSVGGCGRVAAVAVTSLIRHRIRVSLLKSFVRAARAPGSVKLWSVAPAVRRPPCVVFGLWEGRGKFSRRFLIYDTMRKYWSARLMRMARALCGVWEDAEDYVVVHAGNKINDKLVEGEFVLHNLLLQMDEI